MKKRLKKAVTWLMIVCMMMSILPVFGSAAAIEDKPVRSSAWNSNKTVVSAAQSEGELEELNPDDPVGFLMLLFKTIIKNLQSLSVDEILKLPANAMDDITTYIFAIFRLFGVNIDSLFEKLSSFFVTV